MFMLVQEIMTKKVETIDSSDMVINACKKFVEKNLGSLIVTEGSLIVGIITERDFIKKILLEEKNPKNMIVREIMTPNVKTISSLSKVNDAADIMEKNNIKKLPVVYNDNLIGMITERDISLSLAKQIID